MAPSAKCRRAITKVPRRGKGISKSVSRPFKRQGAILRALNSRPNHAFPLCGPPGPRSPETTKVILISRDASLLRSFPSLQFRHFYVSCLLAVLKMNHTLKASPRTLSSPSTRDTVVISAPETHLPGKGLIRLALFIAAVLALYPRSIFVVAATTIPWHAEHKSDQFANIQAPGLPQSGSRLNRRK